MKPANWSLDRKRFLYHSVHSNSFFFPTILPGEGLERYHSYDVSIQSFITKDAFFFSVGKNCAHVNAVMILNLSFFFLITLTFSNFQ